VVDRVMTNLIAGILFSMLVGWFATKVHRSNAETFWLYTSVSLTGWLVGKLLVWSIR
jgi:uncharacterized membrane protein YeaQ/YmgE (transglycosylase-associated protein family)